MERLEQEVRKELGRLPGAAGMAEIVGAWPAAVGDLVARNAWPARLARDGTLHVWTSSSTWAFELAQLGPRILERLRETAGESSPTALRFALGRVPEPAAEAPESRPEPPPAPGSWERECAAELTAAIGDERLRELVARAAAASLARASAGRPV